MNKNELNKVRDILCKWSFFGGHREGRELWAEKPKEVQDKDIADFNRDMKHIKDFVNDWARVLGYEMVEETIKTVPGHESLGAEQQENIAEFIENELEKKEEANMDKPLKDWTLGECKAWCEKSGGECPERCPIERICDLLEQSPAMLDLDEKPRFTEQEVERAKAIKVLWPCAKSVVKADSGSVSVIKPKETYTLDEIIGGAR